MQISNVNNHELSEFLNANLEAGSHEESQIFYSLYNDTKQLKEAEIVSSKVFDGVTYAVIENQSLERVLIPVDDLKGLGLINSDYSLHTTPMSGHDDLVVGQFDDPLEALDALKEQGQAFKGAGAWLIDNKTAALLARQNDDGEVLIKPEFQSTIDATQQLQEYNDIVNQAADKLADKGVVGIIKDGNKVNGSYIGTVSATNTKFAAIDIGRNHLVLLPKNISNAQLEIGQKVNLNFKNGVGQDVSQTLSKSREQGLSR